MNLKYDYAIFKELKWSGFSNGSFKLSEIYRLGITYVDISLGMDYCFMGHISIDFYGVIWPIILLFYAMAIFNYVCCYLVWLLGKF